MPALPAVAGVIRHQWQFTVGEDSTVFTRWYMRYTGSIASQAAMTSYAATLRSAFTGNLQVYVTPQTVLNYSTVTDLGSSTGFAGIDNTFVGGTSSKGTLPGSAAALLNFHIQRRYRGGKPRIYLPAGGQADLQDAQKWNTAFINAITTAWTGVINSLKAAPPTGTTVGVQCNVSYYQGFASVQNPVTHRWRNIPTPRATPVTDDLLGFTVNPKVGSQRRRIAA